MDREKFKKKMNEASVNVDMEDIADTFKIAVDNNTKVDGTPRGFRNLVIVMEELAELTQEVSKYLRGKEDHAGLVEEMADNYLGLICLQDICGVSSEELNKAINVKLDRLKDTLNNKGCFQ